MTRHRSPGGQHNTPVQQNTSDEESTSDKPRRQRTPTPPSVLRGRIVVAAVAAGAFAAAGQAMAAEQDQSDTPQEDQTPLASGQNAAASLGSVTDGSKSGTTEVGGTNKSSDGTSVGGAVPAPEILPVARTTDTNDEVRKLAKSQRVEQAREEALREARQPDYFAPAAGTFTSGFGGRWGTTHYGIDIANSKGTQIVSVAEGTVIEAGPASGFGLWVRVQHNDGTISVYGHVNSITANVGEHVEAGEQIATMGNRGFSTGTHLHFEIWNSYGTKINPLPWLNERGVYVS
ncbi:Peptidase family M23 [Actinopolyspora alba]|uniref:Peptidase family M23 n=1 Tax=Actinopolyspora alba TaxID=673379 RepID=A0A1I1TXI9_9ACTN|nr:M23 family metallopeptidase [Actinopolyspora alba]SFD63327.1 Peptidase family M23 [Actinopolyspora alba]